MFNTGGGIKKEGVKLQKFIRAPKIGDLVKVYGYGASRFVYGENNVKAGVVLAVVPRRLEFSNKLQEVVILAETDLVDDVFKYDYFLSGDRVRFLR